MKYRNRSCYKKSFPYFFLSGQAFCIYLFYRWHRKHSDVFYIALAPVQYTTNLYFKKHKIFWRRGWESNPQIPCGIPVFETGGMTIIRPFQYLKPTTLLIFFSKKRPLRKGGEKSEYVRRWEDEHTQAGKT